MNKALTTGALLVLAVVAAAVVVFMRQPPSASDARSLENQGKHEEAVQAYAAFLLKAAVQLKPPETALARTLPPEEYRERVAEYVDGVRSDRPAAPEDVAAALAGVDRCAAAFKQVNFSTLHTAHPLDTPGYAEQWRNAFFPGMMPLDTSHTSLIRAAYADGLSFVRISSRRSYGYEGVLLHRGTGAGSSFYLYAENSVHIPTPPGEYLLVLRAVATFPSGGTWYSPYSALPVTVPEEVSMVGFTMNTVVEKNAG